PVYAQKLWKISVVGIRYKSRSSAAQRNSRPSCQNDRRLQRTGHGCSLRGRMGDGTTPVGRCRLCANRCRGGKCATCRLDGAVGAPRPPPPPRCPRRVGGGGRGGGFAPAACAPLTANPGA